MPPAQRVQICRRCLPRQWQSEVVECVLCLCTHRSRRGRAEVDADDDGICACWSRPDERILAAGDIGAVAAGMTSRVGEAQIDPSLHVRRLVDDRKDKDGAPRQPGEGCVRGIRRRPIAVADAPYHPRRRLLRRCRANRRAVRGAERPTRPGLPTRQRPEPRWPAPGSERNRGHQLDMTLEYPGRPQPSSKRSRFITLTQAATKSCTNPSRASSLA